MKRTVQPSDLELQILGVLWRGGPMNVRQVLAAMPDGKRRAYTSILSVMQVMEKKGFLTHHTLGNTHVYRPTVARQHVLGGVLRRLVQNVFGGSSLAAVQHLIQDEGLSQEELHEIQRLLDARRRPRHAADDKE